MMAELIGIIIFSAVALVAVVAAIVVAILVYVLICVAVDHIAQKHKSTATKGNAQ
jgi:uncharacterized protein (DUF2062 family)